jgi:hypothetical protein
MRPQILTQIQLKALRTLLDELKPQWLSNEARAALVVLRPLVEAKK